MWLTAQYRPRPPFAAGCGTAAARNARRGPFRTPPCWSHDAVVHRRPASRPRQHHRVLQSAVRRRRRDEPRPDRPLERGRRRRRRGVDARRLRTREDRGHPAARGGARRAEGPVDREPRPLLAGPSADAATDWEERYLEAGFDEIVHGDGRDRRRRAPGCLRATSPTAATATTGTASSTADPSIAVSGCSTARPRAMAQRGRMINVGVDAWDYRPVSEAALSRPGRFRAL